MILLSLLLFLLQLPSLPSVPANQPAMTIYQMVFLRPAATRPAGLTDAAMQKMQQDHLANLSELNRRGLNLLWGPFVRGGPIAGIAVAAVATPDAATRIFENDPYVKSGAMTIDARPWRTDATFHEPVTRNPRDPGALEAFIFGFLADGPNRTQDDTTAAEIQKGHLAYLAQLVQQGTVVAAGPFMTDGSPRGVVIYRVATIEEAKALAAQDPAVKAGRLVLDAHKWMTLKGILK